MITLIAGVLRLDGADADPALVDRMLDAMLGAGLPARQATTQRGTFAAGLLNVSPSGSATPLAPEIRNFDDSILIADSRFYDTDADLLQRLGSESPRLDQNAGDRLHGDFAFAHWNGSGLTLGRDQFGVRPICYTVRDGAYAAFASLPRALLQTGLADRILDAETLKAYPLTAMPVQPRTMFHQIKMVPAAHTVSINPRGQSQSKRYWRLPLGTLIRADAPPDDLAQELRDLMRQAVQRRLPDDHAVAAHLSGGLDSGAVTAIAAATLATHGRRLPAFCLAERRNDPSLHIIDEWPYAQAIADQATNIDLQAIPPTDKVILAKNIDPDMLESVHSNEPEEQILRQTAQAGASVILSGWGGDEVTTWRGYGNLAELFWDGQWQSLRRALRSESRRGGSSAFAIFRKAVLSESLPAPLRNLVRNRHGPRGLDWQDEIASMLPAANRSALDAVPDREYAADSRVQRRGGLEHWSLPGRVTAFAERGARHGIRYAFPMLDLDLLRFTVRLPAVLLKADDRNRAVFRRSMQGILPDKVRLKAQKLTPFPCETLRQSKRKAEMIQALNAMRGNPLVTRFIDLDGLIRYVSGIREPDEIRAWMNETAEAGEQVVQHELYHILAIWLAWCLDRHGTDAK